MHLQECWFEKSLDFLKVYQDDMNKLRGEMLEVLLCGRVDSLQMQQAHDARVASLEAKVLRSVSAYFSQCEEQADKIMALQCQLHVNRESAKVCHQLHTHWV